VTAEPILRLEAVSKRWGAAAVGVADVDLDVGRGEFLCLLGPSGCGKTTTLRLVGGFELPSGGRILLDGEDLTVRPPYHRPVNTVFQDYALFPHMSVAENIGFGLSVARLDRREIGRRVDDALGLVGLTEKAGARIAALSGGQRQRIALARALVNRPKVLLLDEPLAALDAHLREQMQVELKSLQHRLGTTFVMVTHDQTEALAIADRIAVMNRGRLEQVAAPAELYDRPASRFVAGFIGTMNLLDGVVAATDPSGARVEVGGLTVRLAAGEPAPAAGEPICVGLRPEDIAVVAAEAGGVAATVTGVAFHGRSHRLHLALASGVALVAELARHGGIAAPAIGDRVAVAQIGAARAFPAAPDRPA